MFPICTALSLAEYPTNPPTFLPASVSIDEADARLTLPVVAIFA